MRVNFLLGHGFRVSRDDLQLLHTTYNWPHNIKTFLARSAELQRSRKQDLEMVVEGQQEQLLREVCLVYIFYRSAEHGRPGRRILSELK